jgi:hypothetical protein
MLRSVFAGVVRKKLGLTLADPARKVGEIVILTWRFSAGPPVKPMPVELSRRRFRSRIPRGKEICTATNTGAAPPPVHLAKPSSMTLAHWRNNEVREPRGRIAPGPCCLLSCCNFCNSLFP